jgi:hypothetical protein
MHFFGNWSWFEALNAIGRFLLRILDVSGKWITLFIWALICPISDAYTLAVHSLEKLFSNISSFLMFKSDDGFVRKRSSQARPFVGL